MSDPNTPEYDSQPQIGQDELARQKYNALHGLQSKPEGAGGEEDEQQNVGFGVPVAGQDASANGQGGRNDGEFVDETASDQYGQPDAQQSAGSPVSGFARNAAIRQGIKMAGGDRVVKHAILKNTRGLMNKYGSKVLNPFVKDKALQRKMLNNATRRITNHLSDKAGLQIAEKAGLKKGVGNQIMKKLGGDKLAAQIAEKIGAQAMGAAAKAMMASVWTAIVTALPWVALAFFAIGLIIGICVMIASIFGAFSYTRLSHQMSPIEHVYPYSEIQFYTNAWKGELDDMYNPKGNTNGNTNAATPEEINQRYVNYWSSNSNSSINSIYTPRKILLPDPPPAATNSNTNSAGAGSPLDDMLKMLKVIDLDSLGSTSVYRYNAANPGVPVDPISNSNGNNNTNSAPDINAGMSNPYNDAYIAYQASEAEKLINKFKNTTDPLQQDLQAINIINFLRDQLTYEFWPCWKVANQVVGYHWIDETFFHVAISKNDKIYLTKGMKGLDGMDPTIKPTADPDPGMCRYVYHNIGSMVYFSANFSEFRKDFNTNVGNWPVIGKPLAWTMDRILAIGVLFTTPLYEVRMAFYAPKDALLKGHNFVDPLDPSSSKILLDEPNEEVEDFNNPTGPKQPSPLQQHKNGRAFDIYTMYGQNFECAVLNLTPVGAAYCGILGAINNTDSVVTEKPAEGSNSNGNSNDNSNNNDINYDKNDTTGDSEKNYEQAITGPIGSDQRIPLWLGAEVMKTLTVFSMYRNKIDGWMGSAIFNPKYYSYTSLKSVAQDQKNLSLATKDSIPYSILGAQINGLAGPEWLVSWIPGVKFDTTPILPFYFIFQGKIRNGIIDTVSTACQQTDKIIKLPWSFSWPKAYYVAAGLSGKMSDRIHIEFKPTDRNELITAFDNGGNTNESTNDNSNGNGNSNSTVSPCAPANGNTNTL
ncbi:MAG: hypothetical protein WCO23_03145 [bacterium]